MSDYLKGNSARELIFGPLVTKLGQLLPNATTANLFTVNGGNVLVTSMYGQVSVACSSTATTVALGITPTTGSTANSGISTATAITSKEVGTYVAPQVSGGTAGALVVGGSAGSTVYNSVPFVVPPGTITWTTSANNGTGKFNWYLTYVPLDSGAYVS